MENKNITSPLTIVGLFSGIAEIAGTTVLAFLPLELQKIFIWFVIAFPTILLVSFFLTWNFNTKVLYPPDAYPNPDDFLKLMLHESDKVKAKVEKSFNDYGLVSGTILDELREMLKTQANITSATGCGGEKLAEEKIDSIVKKFNQVRTNASEDIANLFAENTEIINQGAIMMALSNVTELSYGQLLRKTKLSKTELDSALSALVNENLILCSQKGTMRNYRKEM